MVCGPLLRTFALGKLDERKLKFGNLDTWIAKVLTNMSQFKPHYLNVGFTAV